MNNAVLTDMKRLAALLLPVRLRQGIMMAILDVMVHPLSCIKRLLSEYADQKERELRITGQTCKLEKLLNDVFDNDGDDDTQKRRIRITDSELVDLPAVYVFPEGDTNNVLHLYPEEPKVYLQLSSEAAGIATDFYVELPRELKKLADDPQLKALVNTYKLASKRWLGRIR